jgi:hypothetical protein
MLHVDGKIFQSVWNLLASPGFLTREQFAGRRARWIWNRLRTVPKTCGNRPPREKQCPVDEVLS